MGLFSRAKQPQERNRQPYERDWSTGPIEPHHLAPDMSGLQGMAERVVVSSQTRDPVQIHEGMYRVLTHEAKTYLGLAGEKAAAETLDATFDAIFGRDDFDPCMLVDCLSYYGPSGVAAARKIAQDLPQLEDALMQIGRKNQSTTATGLADGRVVLENPNLAEHDLKQAGYSLLHGCGMSDIVYGPLSLAECFAVARATAPVFEQTESTPIGAGRLGDRDDGYWVGYESDAGSAIAFSGMPEIDGMFYMKQVSDPLKTVADPWRWAVATLGAEMPEEAAAILRTARAVPVWEIPGLEHTRIQEEPAAQFPEELAHQIQSIGAERMDENVFRAVADVGDGRTQILFIMTWNASSFALASPVAESPEDQIPSWLQGRDVGMYRVESLAERVMLVDLLPAVPTAPSIEEILERGQTLAKYADQLEAMSSAEDNY